MTRNVTRTGSSRLLAAILAFIFLVHPAPSSAAPPPGTFMQHSPDSLSFGTSGWTGFAKNYPNFDPYRGFYAVHLEFDVPHLNCVGILSEGSKIGIWAGLGGYGQRILPFYQTGIAAECVRSPDPNVSFEARYYAWYERFFVSDNHDDPGQAPVLYERQPRIFPGDHISVDVIDRNGVYTLRIKDTTQHWSPDPLVFGCSDVTPIGVEPTCFRPENRGLSIEAVIENPSNKPYPFFEPLRLHAWAATSTIRFGWPPVEIPAFGPFLSLGPDQLTQLTTDPLPFGFGSARLRQTTTVSPMSESAFSVSVATDLCVVGLDRCPVGP